MRNVLRVAVIVFTSFTLLAHLLLGAAGFPRPGSPISTNLIVWLIDALVIVFLLLANFAPLPYFKDHRPLSAYLLGGFVLITTAAWIVEAVAFRRAPGAFQGPPPGATPSPGVGGAGGAGARGGGFGALPLPLNVLWLLNAAGYTALLLAALGDVPFFKDHRVLAGYLLAGFAVLTIAAWAYVSRPTFPDGLNRPNALALPTKIDELLLVFSAVVNSIGKPAHM